jgi:hypothetical protein
MIKFNTTILKFDKKGEKTGWTYIEISAAQARKIKPDNNVSFRVKGSLDAHLIQKTAILPMGEGIFILPINGAMRKVLAKKQGDKLMVLLEEDERQLIVSADLMTCLKDDPISLKFFKSLPGSHQRYYSKWIESAKTVQTKAKRIIQAMEGFAKQKGFSEMMRENKGK